MSGDLSDVFAASGVWTAFEAADDGSGTIAHVVEALEVPKVSSEDGHD